LNISICFDSNYQKWATVCLDSVISNYRGCEKIRLVIVSDLKFDNLIPQLKNVLKKFEFTIDNFDKEFDDLPTGFHFTKAMYGLLSLPKISSSYGLKKSIYIDLDTLVLCDLTELYDIDLERYFCGGVLDIHGHNPELINRLNLKQGFVINSGVLIMDIQKMSTIDWKIEASLLNEKGLIKWGDQDVINMILDEKIKQIDLKWNMQTGYFLHKNPTIPAIVHFTMWASKKPWFTTFRHPYIPQLIKSLWKFKFWNEFTPIFLRFLYNRFLKHWTKLKMSFS